MKEKIKAIICETLEIKDFDWQDSTEPEEIENWDSLRNLKVLTALEDEFDIQLPMSEIQKMTSLGAIVEIITAHT